MGGGLGAGMQQRPMGLGLGGGGGLLGGLNLAGTQKGSVLCSLLTYLVVHLLFSSSSFLLFSLFLSSFFLPSLLSTPLPLFSFLSLSLSFSPFFPFPFTQRCLHFSGNRYPWSATTAATAKHPPAGHPSSTHVECGESSWCIF